MSRPLKSVLVIDDSATLRATAKACLKGAYEVTEAENGRVAVELLRTRTFDLILTDVNMPELDGFGFIEEARKMTSAATTPIVVMTARNAEADVERAFVLGATSYVSKPFTKEALLGVLQRQMGP